MWSVERRSFEKQRQYKNCAKKINTDGTCVAFAKVETSGGWSWKSFSHTHKSVGKNCPDTCIFFSLGQQTIQKKKNYTKKQMQSYTSERFKVRAWQTKLWPQTEMPRTDQNTSKARLWKCVKYKGNCGRAAAKQDKYKPIRNCWSSLFI